MQTVRSRGDQHAADLSLAARRSKDWTCYVRSAPLACAAGAAALGYLAIPPRAKTQTKVVRRKGRRKGGSDDAAGADPSATVERPVSGKGPWMGLAAVIGNVAVRAGTAYLSQQAGSMFGSAAAEAQKPPSSPPPPDSETARGSDPNRGSGNDPGATARNADRPFRGPR